jgi:hypothetical protein
MAPPSHHWRKQQTDLSPYLPPPTLLTGQKKHARFGLPGRTSRIIDTSYPFPRSRQQCENKKKLEKWRAYLRCSGLPRKSEKKTTLIIFSHLQKAKRGLSGRISRSLSKLESNTGDMEKGRNKRKVTGTNRNKQ